MTKLRVTYSCGKFALEPEIVEVTDDEEYWFEPNSNSGSVSLSVGKRPIHPGNMARMTDADWQKLQGQTIPKPRLHIFNLCRVEVLP